MYQLPKYQKYDETDTNTDQNHVCEKHSPPPGKTKHGMLCNVLNMTGWSIRKVWMREEQRSG